MEEALRERRIKTAYLQAAEQNLRQLVSQPNYTLDSLNHAHTSFISRLHEWEQAQHLYERLISDDALENECLAAFNIRAKYTNFNMDIENIITRFSNRSNVHNLNNSVSSEDTESTVASTVTGPVPVNQNIAQSVGVTTTDRTHQNISVSELNDENLLNISTVPLANSSGLNISHVPSNFNLPNVNSNVPISSTPTFTPMVNFNLQQPNICSNARIANVPQTNSNVTNINVPNFHSNSNAQNCHSNLTTQNIGLHNSNFHMLDFNSQNFNMPNPNCHMLNLNAHNTNYTGVNSNLPNSSNPMVNVNSNLPNSSTPMVHVNPNLPNHSNPMFHVNSSMPNSSTPMVNSNYFPSANTPMVNFSVPNASFPMNHSNMPNYSNSSQNVHSPHSKLDKLKLPRFYGQVEEWQSYWEVFRSHVHDTNLPTITKFTYLKMTLRGEAAKAIEGYSLVEANYSTVVERLIKRFGRNDLIIQTHIQSLLLDVSVVSQSSDLSKYISNLWNFNDTITAHIRSLEALGIQGEVVQIFLCPIILSKLPEPVRIEWFKKERPSGNLTELLDFIDYYITTLSRTNILTRGTASARPKEKQNSSVLHTNSKTSKCLHCQKDHSIETCKQFLDLSISDRITRVKMIKCCMRCLTKNHTYAKCKFTCSACTKNHHHLLCLGSSAGVTFNNAGKKSNGTGEKPKVNIQTGEKSNAQTGEKPKLNVNAPSFTTSNSALVQHCGSKITVLQTAKCSLINNSKSLSVNLLFDSGSDRTYVRSEMARECELNPINSEEIVFNSFGNKKSSNPEKKNVYNLELAGINQIYHVKAIEMDNICKPLFRQRIPSEIIDEFKLSNVVLADDYDTDRLITVDILIGLDYLYDLLNPIVSIKHNSLVAHESAFGWIFSGAFSPSNQTQVLNITTQMCCFSSVNSGQIQKFWELEVMGVSSKETLHCLESNDVISKFKDELKFENGHYTVNLLWKPQKVTLVNNFPIALRRFKSLERFLSTKPQLRDEYFQVFVGYQNEGKIEVVPEDEILHPKREPFYIPHFPIIKERSVSTRI